MKSIMSSPPNPHRSEAHTDEENLERVRELWMAGNLFKHVHRCAMGLYALGDLIRAVDAERLDETTLNGLGNIIYEIGGVLSQTAERR